MMPLMLAGIGEENTIKKIGGSPEIKKHLEDLGFVVGGSVTVVNALGGNVIVNVKESRVAISEEMARRIRLIGFERAFLSTDRGQKGQPCAVSELLTFCERLSALGFTRTEIHELVHTVPGSIVNQI